MTKQTGNLLDRRPSLLQQDPRRPNNLLVRVARFLRAEGHRDAAKLLFRAPESIHTEPRAWLALRIEYANCSHRWGMPAAGSARF